MTDQELKDYLKEWAKDYCRRDFLVDNPDYDPEDEESEEFIEELPSGVVLFLENAFKSFGDDIGITSKRLGDYSVSYKEDILGGLAGQYLRRYKLARFV